MLFKLSLVRHQTLAFELYNFFFNATFLDKYTSFITATKHEK